jgi:hypothetical protein
VRARRAVADMRRTPGKERENGLSKQMLIALFGGGLSAVVALAFLTGTPGALFLAYLAPLPLLLVGLGFGVSAGTVAGGAGFLTTVALGGMVTAGLYAVVNAVPALVVVRTILTRRSGAGGTQAWYPAGFTLSWLTALAAGLFVTAAFMAWGSGSGVAAAVTDFLDQALATMLPHVSSTKRGDLVAATIPLFPGMVGASWILMTTVNGALAQGILVRAGHNVRPSPRLADLVLPDWMSWLLVASAAVALVGPGEWQYTGRNLALISAVPFFFLGLAVVHTLVNRVSFSGSLLVVFYFMLIFSNWAAGVTAGIGMIEQWAGLRHRFSGPNKRQGDE